MIQCGPRKPVGYHVGCEPSCGPRSEGSSLLIALSSYPRSRKSITRIRTACWSLSAKASGQRAAKASWIAAASRSAGIASTRRCHLCQHDPESDQRVGEVGGDGVGAGSGQGPAPGDGFGDRVSTVAVDAAGEPVCACLVTAPDEGRVWIGYIFSDPQWKNRGVGRMVVAESLVRIAASGHTQVVAVVTDGNVTSKRLLTGLVFVRDGPH